MDTNNSKAVQSPVLQTTFLNSEFWWINFVKTKQPQPTRTFCHFKYYVFKCAKINYNNVIVRLKFNCNGFYRKQILLIPYTIDTWRDRKTNSIVKVLEWFVHFGSLKYNWMNDGVYVHRHTMLAVWCVLCGHKRIICYVNNNEVIHTGLL